MPDQITREMEAIIAPHLQEFKAGHADKVVEKLVSYTAERERLAKDEALISSRSLELLDRLREQLELNYSTWGNSEKMMQVSGLNKWIESERKRIKGGEK